MARTVPLLVLGLALAGLLLFALLGGGADDTRAFRPEASDAAPSRPTSSVVAVASPMPPTETVDATAEDRPRRQAALPARDASFTLHVIVVGDETGPLAGAEVEVRYGIDGDERAHVVLPPLRTDDDGRASVVLDLGRTSPTWGDEGLAVSAEVRAAGHQPQSDEGTFEPRETPEHTLRFELSPGGTLTGRVLDSTGSPAGDATVHVMDGADWHARATTDEDGEYVVLLDHAGTYHLHARADGRGTAGAHGLALELDRAQEAPDLYLSGAGAIAGRVLDPDGRPVSEVDVRAVLANLAPPEAQHSYVSVEPTEVEGGDGLLVAQIATDAEGRFHLAGLRPGNYLVSARVQETGTTSPGVHVETGTSDVELELEAYRLKVVVEGETARRPYCVEEGQAPPTTEMNRGQFVYFLHGGIPQHGSRTLFPVKVGQAYWVGLHDPLATIEVLGLLGNRIAPPSAEPANFSGVSSEKRVTIRPTEYLTVVTLQAEPPTGELVVTCAEASGEENYTLFVKSKASGQSIAQPSFSGAEFPATIRLSPGAYELELRRSLPQRFPRFHGYIGQAEDDPQDRFAVDRDHASLTVVEATRTTWDATFGAGGRLALSLPLREDDAGPDEGLQALMEFMRTHADMGEATLTDADGTSWSARLSSALHPSAATGERAGRRTLVVTHAIQPGRYVLRYAAPGCEPLEHTVEIRAGEELVVSLDPKPR